ncbi:MAG: hypothetical protein CMF59_05475 [Leptospiraceae bacterium]|nr:hypothetical protein [Leptospiraceae bacterium]
MKEWRPDRQFKKADFPLKKEEKSSGKDNPSTSKKASPSQSRPPAQSAPEPDQGEGQPPLKGWSVPKLGGGHVIAGGNSRSKAASDVFRDTLPESEEGASASGKSGSVIPGGGSAEMGPRGAEKKDMTRVYLSQLVGQDPRAATDILRNWYWEKPGRESPVKYIPPKNRIHLILRSLSKEALLALYEMMTPVERRQMEEIRKEPMHVNEREILKLRQYFMARMTGQV